MTPAQFLVTAIDPALALLPLKMASDDARAMVLAIAWQESKLAARRQQPVGPGRGFPQYEPGDHAAIAHVLTHRSSRVHAAKVCQALVIEPRIAEIYRAIEFHDVLAAAFARLLLWIVPDAMPGKFDVDIAWRIYVKAWKPGKPRPVDWPESYAIGWRTVDGRVGAIG